MPCPKQILYCSTCKSNRKCFCLQVFGGFSARLHHFSSQSQDKDPFGLNCNLMCHNASSKLWFHWEYLFTVPKKSLLSRSSMLHPEIILRLCGYIILFLTFSWLIIYLISFICSTRQFLKHRWALFSVPCNILKHVDISLS